MGIASTTSRDCAGCTLCCKVMRVPALDKPMGTWCGHCDVRTGCRIYERRPSDCREFRCGFLTRGDMDESWRPSKSRLIFVENRADNMFAIHVDPQRPDAWRQEPYHGWLRRFAHEAVMQSMAVLVFINHRIWVVHPDRDEDLGAAAPGDVATVKVVAGPGGPRCVVRKVSKP